MPLDLDSAQAGRPDSKAKQSNQAHPKSGSRENVSTSDVEQGSAIQSASVGDGLAVRAGAAQRAAIVSANQDGALYATEYWEQFQKNMAEISDGISGLWNAVGNHDEVQAGEAPAPLDVKAIFSRPLRSTQSTLSSDTPT
jgi:hypothetical protein